MPYNIESIVKHNEKLSKDFNKKGSFLVPEISHQPKLSFKYLHNTNKSMVSLCKSASNAKQYFKTLEEFINGFCSCDSFSNAIRLYASKNGSKIKNDTTKQIKNQFFKYFPQDDLLKHIGNVELLHLHAEKNGKGKFLIYGVEFGSVFYVLAFDPEHQST